MKPELESITWAKWQLFCTLTFKGHVPSIEDQRKIAFAWLRATAHDFSVPFRRLVWVLRQERGDARGRLHLHALIAGLPSDRLDTIARFHIASLWTKKSGRGNVKCGGFAQVHPYDANSSCASYTLKPERVEKNAAETRRFGGADDVMVSKSLPAYLSRGVQPGK